MKRLLLIFSFILISTITSAAQTTSDQEVDLMQRAQMVAEIKKLRAETVSKDIIIATQKSQIEDLKRLDQVQETRIADLKEAIKHMTTATDLSPRIENLYRERITDYQAENARLRSENDKLRKSRDRFGLTTGLGGLILGMLVF